MIISNNRTIRVANLLERNAIEIKPPGMRVAVTDTTGDQNASGEAIYLWDSTMQQWNLESPEDEALEKVVLTTDDIGVTIPSLSDIGTITNFEATLV